MAEPREPSRPELTVGAATAIGAGAGAALFAATEQPWWIGVGAGVGAALGAALTARPRPR